MPRRSLEWTVRLDTSRGSRFMAQDEAMHDAHALASERGSVATDGTLQLTLQIDAENRSDDTPETAILVRR